MLFKKQNVVISINSGWKNGAATCLERKMGKNLLWLPCRHHVMELVLESVFVATFGKSQGPEFHLFKKFQDQWNTMDASTKSPFKAFPSILNKSRRTELINFAEQQINVCNEFKLHLHLS